MTATFLVEFLVQFHFALDFLHKANQFLPIGIEKDRGDEDEVDKGDVAEENHFRNKFDQFDKSKHIFLKIEKWTFKIIDFFHEFQLIYFEASLAVESKVCADDATTKKRNKNCDHFGRGLVFRKVQWNSKEIETKRKRFKTPIKLIQYLDIFGSHFFFKRRFFSSSS